MKDTKINPVSLVITALAIIGITLLLVHAERHGQQFVPSHPDVTSVTPPALSTTTPDTTAPAAAQPVTICYALNTADKASLKITTTDGLQATGTLNIALSGKDASKGTLTGTLTSNSDNTGAVFDGSYSNNQEGMNNNNEQIIQLGADSAKIGYGEMVASGNNSYIYKDKAAINYSLTIPRVDCAQ